MNAMLFSVHATAGHPASCLHIGFEEGMEIMRKLIAAAAALALAMPVAVIPTAPAQAQSHYKGKSSKSRTYYKKCRRSTGTAGLVGGAAVGVLAGPAIIGHGLLGAAVGGVGGALGGRAIDRSITAKKRCHYVRR
ncbi:hypothetical protein JMG10_28980 [Nostoc ellipsosporum NOK]|nr:hypothetical protein [Nostoc ellipsosporum NOK]